MPSPSSVLYPSALTFPGDATAPNLGGIVIIAATAQGIRIDDTTWRRP